MENTGKAQPGIMLYWEAFDAIEAMLDGDAKRMLKAIRMYAQYGEEPDFANNPSMKMAWYFMRGSIDRDKGKYAHIRAINSEKGKKSGEMRRAKREAAPNSWGMG